MATTAQNFFQVDSRYVTKCKECGEPLYWQTSRKPPYKKYPTEVLVMNGAPVTSRTNFHRCDQGKRDAFQRRQAEANGQQSFTMPAAPKLNMDGVNKLFDTATAAGLKWPKIRLQTPSGLSVVLARMGKQARYPGQIRITDGKKYPFATFFGRIDEQGIYHAQQQSTAEVATLLEQLGSDPASVAAGYGKLTGNCCFCLRALDDPRSVSVGYGPVCAGHYGLPWGSVTIQPQTAAQPVSKPVTPVPAIPAQIGPWNRSEENGQVRWVMEASQLRDITETVRCPSCKAPVQFGYVGCGAGLLEPQRRGEDFIGWFGSCLCGVQLSILND